MKLSVYQIWKLCKEHNISQENFKYVMVALGIITKKNSVEFNPIEEKVIEVISMTTVATVDEVKYIYRRTKSFDKTILCAQLMTGGVKLNESLFKFLES